jgi:Tfp pilus assembly protein PilN
MSVLTEKTAAPVSRPAPPAGERMQPLNVARRPFTNTRPVTRIALLLWLLGALLLLGNVSLFWNYLSGSGEKRAELGRLETQVANESQAVSRLEARLAASGLDKQNSQVRFLNRRIAERTFSWSQLFDRLAEVLPDGVRLNRLAPSGLVDKEARDVNETQAQAQAQRDNRVTLTISGEAKSDEVIYRFVDNLFAHPAFEDPDISRESVADDGLVKFEIKVMYLPSGTPQAAPIVIEEQTPTISSPPPAPTHPANSSSEVE